MARHILSRPKVEMKEKHFFSLLDLQLEPIWCLPFTREREREEKREKKVPIGFSPKVFPLLLASLKMDDKQAKKKRSKAALNQAATRRGSINPFAAGKLPRESPDIRLGKLDQLGEQLAKWLAKG